VESNAESIIAELNRIFVEQFELSPEAIVPDAKLREDLDLDSLDAADMLIAIEKRFGIRLDDQVARTFRTVGDIHAYVHKLVAEKAAGTGGDAASPAAS
jgi:acyl carrier protein